MESISVSPRRRQNSLDLPLTNFLYKGPSRTIAQISPSIMNNPESLDQYGSSTASQSSKVCEYSLDTEAERKAVRKLDLTVLPVVTMFYFLSFLVSAGIRNWWVINS